MKLSPIENKNKTKKNKQKQIHYRVLFCDLVVLVIYLFFLKARKIYTPLPNSYYLSKLTY